MVASLVVKVRTLFHFQTTQTISCYMFCTFQATLIKLILFIIARYIKYKWKYKFFLLRQKITRGKDKNLL